MTFMVGTLLTLLFWSTTTLAAVNLKIAVHEAYIASPTYQLVLKFIKNSLERENINVEFVSLPVERASRMVDRGELDGEALRIGLTPNSFPNIIKTSFPVVKFRYLVVHRHGVKINKANISNSRGVYILNVHGIEDFLKEFSVHLTQVSSTDAGIKMIQQRRAEFFIMPEPILSELKQKNPNLDLEYSESMAFEAAFYFRLNKKHSAIMKKLETDLKLEKKSHINKYKELEPFFGF